MSGKNGKEKKAFQMPHLFWIMMALLLFACLLTYIVPAGQFAVDENGRIMGDNFSYTGSQSPISPWKMLNLILNGLSESSIVIWTVLLSGAMTVVVMATGAIEELLNWSIFKLKDSNENILISILFILMVYLGAFGGTDALIAVVPIGVIFCKKLKLDPVCAIGVTSYATLLGFGTGPTKQFITQMMMDVPVYGAFFTMFISMNAYMVLGLFFLLRYVKQIRKDPTKSIMWNEGWNPENEVVTDEDEKKLSAGTTISGRSILIMVIFLAQYGVVVAYPLLGGNTAYLMHLMSALAIVVSVICGLLGGFSFDKVGNEVVKGLQGLVFVGFVIGLARVMSIILTDGQVIHTLVYAITRPLMSLSRSVSSIAMTAVISVINVLIPSATSKVAILVPILKPITETLNLDANLAVQAFQYGDGFTNMISPFLGWTVGSCVMAGVPFPKWFKWVIPKVLAFMALSFVIMFLLTETGWTAF